MYWYVVHIEEIDEHGGGATQRGSPVADKARTSRGKEDKEPLDGRLIRLWLSWQHQDCTVSGSYGIGPLVRYANDLREISECRATRRGSSPGRHNETWGARKDGS